MDTKVRPNTTKKALSRQIKDRNFLQPIGFQFSVVRAPKVSFFGNAVNIPGIEVGVTEQPNYLRTLPIPGDMMEFQDLSLKFLVDENLENYIEIQNWIRGIGFPESLSEIYKFQDQKDLMRQPDKSTMNLYSDGTLHVLSNISLPKFKVQFRDLFPYSLSTIEFDAGVSDMEYVTAEVIFKYSLYTIEAIGSGHCP